MNAGDAPRFLTLESVMALHRRSLSEHGGRDGVRDASALASALAAGENAWFYGHGDLHDVAAAYAFHFAEAQACIDGNKRTAVASAVVFLLCNGCSDRMDETMLYDAMIAIASRRKTKAQLAAELRLQFPSA